LNNKFIAKYTSIYNKVCFPYTRATDKNKCIFVHIPKAAGTSIRRVIGEPLRGRRHLPWWVYQQASPSKFNEYFKFAFVRDPAARAFSGFNYLRSGGNGTTDTEISELLSRFNTFDQFVAECLSSTLMIQHQIFRPQHTYLCNWKGELMVDYLGRFESIDTDFKEIARRLNLETHNPLPIINRSEASAKSISPNTKDILRQIYKADYEILGY
jgi:hypothetical protein